MLTAREFHVKEPLPLHALHVAKRVRELAPTLAYRVHQAPRDAPRHLADIRRPAFAVEDAVVLEGVRFAPLVLLVAMKVLAHARRGLSPKGATDLADLRRLLLAHPELRDTPSTVEATIALVGGDASAHEAWSEPLRSPLVADDDVDGGY